MFRFNHQRSIEPQPPPQLTINKSSMPKLKQINCSIELGPSNTKLKEYGARYSDGHVEAFIAVPDTDIPFTIHLTTEGHIAPGIAFFVFMDGEYQCNRNRVCLKLPGEGVQPKDYETDFRLRQKEEKTTFGTFVVRDWTFAKLDRGDVLHRRAPGMSANSKQWPPTRRQASTLNS